MSAIRAGYKQTELGKIPEDWICTSVGKLVQLGILDKPLDGNHGNIHPKSGDLVDFGIPFVMANNVQGGRLDLHNCSFIRKEQADALQKGFSRSGDVLLTHKATIGNTAIVGEIFFPYLMLTPQVTYYRVTDEQRLNNVYLRHFFDSSSFQKTLHLMSGGGTRSYIGITAQLQLPVVVPPTVTEQEAIAEALSDADALIESLEQLLAKKRHLKQGTMQELLTGKKRLPGFSGEWEEKSFGEVLSRVNAKLHQVQTSDYQAAGIYPVVDQGKEHVVGYSDKHNKRYQCPAGGVIVFGDHTCIVKFVDFDFLVGADGTQVIEAKAGQCARFHALQLQYKGIPTTGYNRHFKFLKERLFVAPPLAEQTAIATVLSDMDAEIATLESQLTKTRALKQGMMQKLFTGEIRLI